MRHAHAEQSAPLGDRLRPLDQLGRDQAAKIGGRLRDAGIQFVLASSAARTVQTAAALGLGVPTETLDALYYGGTGTYLRSVRSLDDAVERALVVGHNPSIADAVDQLLDETTSDPAALALIATHFPTATCCELVFDGSWADLTTAALVRVLRTKQPKSGA
jgi:phosphohistidine phosphatase